jgi:hypothetical protein
MSNGFIGPRRPDPRGVYESPWGDIRDVGSPFAGLAGGEATFLIPFILSFLSAMFEKEKDPLEEAMNLKSQMGILGFKPPYQSPYAKGLDPIVLKALLAQMGRTSNWGWPSGMGIDTSFITDALGKIGAGRFGASLPGAIRRS